MNLRIRKKKYDKYMRDKIAHITIPFQNVSFVFTAARAKGIDYTYLNPEFQKFINSRNANRAVKSKLKKTLWKRYKCRNIDLMYRNMFEEIETEKRYQEQLKRINEMIKPFTDEEVREAAEMWEQKERCWMMFEDIN